MEIREFERTKRHSANGASVTTESPNQTSIGRHLLADLYGIDKALLTDEKSLVDLFIQSCIDAGCQVLSHTSRKFSGKGAGVTGLILLAESHAAFHTYPELNYMAVDVFVCGSVNPEDVIAPIADALHPERVTQKIEFRGCAVKPID